MKLKNNNIKNNLIWLTKGLIILILLFFTKSISAQKTFEKSITSRASKIIVDFSLIDQIELMTWEEKNRITVIADSEVNQALDLVLEEKNGVVFIKSLETSIEYNEFEIDKQCSVQPIYTSFKIYIPKNKKVEISILQGNFYTNNFKGDLNLRIEEGIIKINKFKGTVNVQVNIGKVYIDGVNNTDIDVKSNMGIVTSELIIKDKIQNKSYLKGVFGENYNQLNIQAILANIQLKSSKN